jgi:hypothetical protein
MLKNDVIRISLLTVMAFYCTYGEAAGLREQAKMVENYETTDSSAIIDAVQNDLVSEDALLQDAGCIMLLKVFKKLQRNDAKAQAIFTRLSRDRTAVSHAEEIIDSRLAGWCSQESIEGIRDNREIYTPLLHLLGIADDKASKGTIINAFLHLDDRGGIVEIVPVSEQLVSVSLNRLKIIGSRLCCLYPGNTIVARMLEFNLRSGLLGTFEHHLKTNVMTGGNMEDGIREFIIDCMEYGDSKNGYSIRIKAMKIAGMLAKNGEQNVYGKIEFLAKNDLFYVHRYDSGTGYSMTELRYPVRETGSRILLQLNSGEKRSGQKAYR